MFWRYSTRQALSLGRHRVWVARGTACRATGAALPPRRGPAALTRARALQLARRRHVQLSTQRHREDDVERHQPTIILAKL